MIDFIRPDEAFDSADDLIAQMDRDCAEVREILAAIDAADPMLEYPIGRAIASSTDAARK